MPHISYQLYSSRNWDATETFEMLQTLGIDEVEGFGPFVEDPVWTRTLLDAYNLSMPTGHFAMEHVESAPENVITTAKMLGMEAVIVPYLAPEVRPTNAVGWRAFAQHLARVAAPITSAGLEFAWHNHDFDLIPVEGVVPIELIADASQDIKIELDLAWVQASGQDPVHFLRAFAGRLIAVHLKDIAPPGENRDEDGWADLGHGTMDWEAIVPALEATGVERYVIEHDNPSDHAHMARRSLASALAF